MSREKFGLSGNALKLIAIVIMTIDHIGMQLMPQNLVLRIIGRLAFPIFAYMIAEGCTYTKNRRKYLLTILAFAAVCQIVYLVAMQSLYMCILVTFSLSIILIYALDYAKKRKTALSWILCAAVFAAVFFISEVVPDKFNVGDFRIDYDFTGILVPVLIYLGRNKREKLVLTAAALLLLSLTLGWIQWYCLLALPLLALYNGKRGKGNMKYLFYFYYPLHLVAIYFLSYII
ncbi:MAG: hypothetical protein IJ017_05205 [Oscillospiraceae bacterium]|nr:hypothetical protein [Oscillospiraceae bacterium]